MTVTASSHTPSGAGSVTTGIALMIGAFAVFSLIDVSAKYLVGSYPFEEIVAARYVLSVVYVVVLMVATGSLTVRSHHLGLQVVRGLLLLASTGLNFFALQYLHLAQTSAIFFSNPLWVCALSVPLLGERIGPRRWLAVIVGFVGVLVIMRPWGAGFHWAMILSLGNALVGAIYQIVTRKVGGRDPALVSLFLGTVVGAGLIAPVAVPSFVMPDLPGFAVMAFMGFCGGLGHHLLIRAHRMAQAPTLAPFVYTQIVWMVLLGYVVFGDVPDLYTLLGGGLVIASGLYVYHRERRLKQAAAFEA